MKTYKSQIFMGKGESSMAECYSLVTSLHEAFSYISALQQAPRSDMTEEQTLHIEDMEYYVERTAQNIYTALTGRRFNLKGDLIVEANPTKKCPNTDENGNCPLHNLHCQYPDCETIK